MGDDVLTPELVVLKVCFVSIFMIFSIFGNASVLIVVIKYKEMQSVPNLFVCSLSLADILYAVFGSTSIIVTTLKKRWVLGQILCDIVGTSNTLFCTASVWTLVAISINRYYAVSKPLRVRHIFTIKKSIVIIIMIWIFSLAISLLPVLGWSRYIPGDNYCLMDPKKHISYSLTLICVNYIITGTTLISIYVRMYFIMRQYNNRRRRLTSAYISSTLSIRISPKRVRSKSDTDALGKNKKAPVRRTNSAISSPPESNLSLSDVTPQQNNEEISMDELNSNINCRQTIYELEGPKVKEHRQQRRKASISVDVKQYLKLFRQSSNDSVFNSTSCPQNQANQKPYSRQRAYLMKQTKVTTMLVAVILAFFFCWTPFLVASLLYTFDVGPPNFGLLTVAIVLTGSNGVINPIVYSIMSKNFRDAFKKMYMCRSP